jgi:hypothetical protein
MLLSCWLGHDIKHALDSLLRGYRERERGELFAGRAVSSGNALMVIERAFDI